MDEIVARNKASSTCLRELYHVFSWWRLHCHIALLCLCHMTTSSVEIETLSLLGKRCISTWQTRGKSVGASGAQEGLHLAAAKSCLASTHGADFRDFW